MNKHLMSAIIATAAMGIISTSNASDKDAKTAAKTEKTCKNSCHGQCEGMKNECAGHCELKGKACDKAGKAEAEHKEEKKH